MSNKTATVAIIVVIDLNGTGPYGPYHREREENGGNGKKACGVVWHVLSGGDKRGSRGEQHSIDVREKLDGSPG
jgi:hypothetical protein